MYQSFEIDAEAGQIAGRVPACVWSVVLPFFNEAGHLAETIAGLARQSASFELILVDNGSTDGSVAIAAAAARASGLNWRLLVERRPGKVAALQTGIAAVATRWVATCDADTWYPPHYLAAAGALLARPGCVAAGAYYVRADQGTEHAARAARKILAAARLLPNQCHTGGAGQVFDSGALRRAGGFDPARWNMVLEDHEIIHQLLKHGRVDYAQDLWCAPSPRERKRPSTRWTLIERIAYHLLSDSTGDWFFTGFLGPRLARRKLTSERLREAPAQAWQPQQAAA
ncbi:hypothetical protein BH10PSE15_BH10PSE15_17060 [soil metagenome]